MLIIDYSNVNVWNKKRVPNFVGIKENGNMVSFQFPYESWEEIGKAIPNKVLGCKNRLNIYENGEINISEIWRNDRREEWEEEIVVSLKGKEKEEIEKGIRFMLFNSPIARRSDNLFIKTYDQLIEFLKKGDF